MRIVSRPWPRYAALVTTAQPSQLSVSIVVKLLNCFDTIGRNVNKQSQICGPHIFNQFIFLQYFYMHE